MGHSMRRCPLCDGEANSPHHIKPLLEGGTDEPRNIVYLCRRCHDEIEGLGFTPELVTKMRRARLGKAASQEEYWWLYRYDGVMFIGIHKPRHDELIHFDILIPYDSQMPLLRDLEVQNTSEEVVAKISPTITIRKRGRPKIVLSEEQVSLLLGSGESLRKKALKSNLRKDTVRRRPKQSID